MIAQNPLRKGDSCDSTNFSRPIYLRNRYLSLARADRTRNREWYDPKSILYKVALMTGTSIFFDN